MSWALIVVAAAVVVSLSALAVSLKLVSEEIGRLRHSMRRTRAAAVAHDDLRHLTRELSTRASELDQVARIRRLRSRRQSIDR
ncbi:MAG: hypothetical protein OXN44_13570 [Acidimicrobiaceae bacterium]|nr:hypothetical protein [Acidimicrobiaceae bacterium]MDE0606956.1 hypothetical protein [Acidimicrobiaceae bacterium]